MTQMAKITLLW